MGIGDILGGAGNGSNKLIVWALVLVIIFGFGKGKKFNNFNFQKQPYSAPKSSKSKYASQHRKKRHITEKTSDNNSFNNKSFFNFGTSFGGGSKGIGKILGGNALFIVVIVAVIFFCKEKEEKEKVREEEREEAREEDSREYGEEYNTTA